MIGALVVACTACSAQSDKIGAPSSSPSVGRTSTVAPTVSPSATTTAPTPTVVAGSYLAVSEGASGYYFVSPSGRWRCAILTSAAVAGCQPASNTDPSIGVAGAPTAVPSPVGTTVRPNAIRVERGRDAEFAYRGQADFWRFPLEQTPVLPYGTELAADGFACNTSSSGVSCMDQSTGKGFTFSDAGFVWKYTPVGSTAQVPPPTPASVDFTGDWMGHGRLVTLRSDGTATVKLANGASNGSTWDATWRQTGSSMQVVFTSETQHVGEGAGRITPGMTWTGSLTSAEGAPVLAFADAPTVYWCRESDTGSGVCGA
ncbi:hypothetical protein GCM10009722_19860 [Williamsia deligens]